MKAPATALLALALFFGSAMLAGAGGSKFCAGCNLAGATLENSDFSNAVYVGANFENARLAGSSFRGARLVAANFSDADLRRVDFDGVDCLACNFNGAHLDDATFSHAQMSVANFKGFDSALAGEQLRALLSGCIVCDFSKSNLRARDLSGLPLISVDLSQAELTSTSFAGAVLCWYDGSAVPQTKCDALAGAAVAGANFQGVQVCQNPITRSGCTVVSVDALRRYSGSQLDGALLTSR